MDEYMLYNQEYVICPFSLNFVWLKYNKKRPVFKVPFTFTYSET